MIKSKEEAIRIAEEVVKAVDSRGIEDPEVDVPSWLKLTEDGSLQWYFDWKSVKWRKGIGWYPDSERIML